MSRELSDWQELLDSFARTGAKQGKIESFRRIENGCAERIRFLLEDSELRSVLIKWMSHQVKREKCLEVSVSLRETGNKQFSLKDYSTCIETYTDSILCCPCENTTELSLAFANRSAALFELHLYEDCLEDINMAISKNYPSNLLPKILMRKAKVFKKLGLTEDFTNTMADLELAIHKLEISEKDKEKLNSDVKLLAKFKADVEEDSCEDTTKDHLSPFCGENPLFKGASEALEIRHSPEKGRFVVANRDIKAGETLFVEKPTSLVVLPDFQNIRCHHCTHQMGIKRFPCLGCGKIWFCSRLCRTNATCYHTYECGLQTVLNSVGIAHLGLRIVVSFGLQNILSFLSNLDKVGQIPGIDGHYDTEDYSVVFHLVSHTETMIAEELYQYALTASFLTLLLEQHTKFFEGAPTDSRFLVGGLILTHICQLVCNAHAITELCELDESSLRQERIATAIYPSASMMNHSCDPTVINSFQGKELIVRAIKDVKQGDEVFNCYGPHYRRMKRSERIEVLKAQYQFACSCNFCGDDSIEDFLDELYSFSCPSCQGSLMNPDGKNPFIEQHMTVCRSCKKPQHYFEQLKSDLEAVSLDALGTEAMDNGDFITAIKLLSKSVQLRRKALYKGHPDLGKSADKLAQCYAFLGKFEECEEMLEVSLMAVEKRFGRYSIEMANEMQKYTDVLIELAPNRDHRAQRELSEFIELAILIFQIHYGPWSSSCKEMLSKKARLKS